MFEIGDLVQVAEKNCFGKHNKTPKGLKRNHIYRIKDIHRGIDGAYDWDDLFFDGIPVIRHKDGIEGQFCEFDFELAKTE